MRWPQRAPCALKYGDRERGGDEKGSGQEADSVRAMYDVCAAHGDRTADVDTQSNSLHEDETHFPLDARVECRALVSEKNPGWFALALRRDGNIPRFHDEPEGKEDGGGGGGGGGAVFIRNSVTNEDPPNVHQAQQRPKPGVR